MINPDRTQAPSVRELSGMKLPEPRDITLANGIKLVILNSGSQPVSRLTFAWDGGLLDMPHQATAKVMAASLGEGTETRSGAEIAELLEFNGAWTRYDIDNHYVTATVYSLNSHLADLLPVITDVLAHPSFPDDVIDTQCKKLAAEYQTNRKKVVVRVNEIYRPMVYGIHHPAAATPTDADFLRVTRSGVAELFRRSLGASAPTVYLAGRVDDALLGVVTAELEKMEFRNTGDAVSIHVIPAQYNPAGDFSVCHLDDALQSAIRQGIPSIPRSHPDYMKLRLAVVALGGYFGSRLMTNIREEKGYTYGINSILISGKGEGSFMVTNCQTDNRYVDAVLSEMRREIERLSETPMDEEELTGVRRLTLSSLAGVLDSPFTAMDYIYSLRIFGLPHSTYAKQVEASENITAEEISRVMREHILPNITLTAVAGNYTRQAAD